MTGKTRRINLRIFAELSQVVGAAGVIVSLLYLAAEVRQNTKALRAGTFQDMTSNAIEIRSFTITDTAFLRFWTKAALTPDSLTELERIRWNSFMGAGFRNFENMHYQYWSGMLDEEIWMGYDRLTRGFAAQPGYRRWYLAHADQFSPRFQRYMADVMKSPKPFGPVFSRELQERESHSGSVR